MDNVIYSEKFIKKYCRAHVAFLLDIAQKMGFLSKENL